MGSNKRVSQWLVIQLVVSWLCILWVESGSELYYMFPNFQTAANSVCTQCKIETFY